MPGILWSDRRAAQEAAHLAGARGVDQGDASAPGGPLDAASVAAKVAWLSGHRPAELASAVWMLTPRDLVAWRMTGEVVTDTTMASRAGLHDAAGRVDTALAGEVADRLPPAVPSDTVVGSIEGSVAEHLGVASGTPVVIGAGDRACEVLGTGATEARPLVSWGTTANVSVPVKGEQRPAPPSGSGGVAWGRRRVAARSGALGCGLVPRLAQPADRRRSVGARLAGHDESAGRAWRRGHPVARGRPSSVVATVRGRMPGRHLVDHRNRRPRPCGLRVGRMGGAALPRRARRAPTSLVRRPPSSRSAAPAPTSRCGPRWSAASPVSRRAGAGRDRPHRRAPRSSRRRGAGLGFDLEVLDPPVHAPRSGSRCGPVVRRARRPCGPPGRSGRRNRGGRFSSRVAPPRGVVRAPATGAGHRVRVRARCPSRCCSTSQSRTNC